MLVSSASSFENTSSVTVARSLIYIKNSSGPQIEPCGTPHVTFSMIDLALLNDIYCLLYVR